MADDAKLDKEIDSLSSSVNELGQRVALKAVQQERDLALQEIDRLRLELARKNEQLYMLKKQTHDPVVDGTDITSSEVTAVTNSLTHVLEHHPGIGGRFYLQMLMSKPHDFIQSFLPSQAGEQFTDALHAVLCLLQCNHTHSVGKVIATLAENHASYFSLNVSDFEPLYIAFLDVLAEFVEDTSVMQPWNKFYSFFLGQLNAGFLTVQNRRREEQEEMEKAANQQDAPEDQEEAAVPPVVGQAGVVLESVIELTEAGHNLGDAFFERLLTFHPRFRPIFGTWPPREDGKGKVDLKAHIGSFNKTVATVVQLIADNQVDTAIHAVIQLGKRHGRIPVVQLEHFEPIQHALFTILPQIIPTWHQREDYSQCWQAIWSVLKSTLYTAIKEEQAIFQAEEKQRQEEEEEAQAEANRLQSEQLEKQEENECILSKRVAHEIQRSLQRAKEVDSSLPLSFYNLLLTRNTYLFRLFSKYQQQQEQQSPASHSSIMESCYCYNYGYGVYNFISTIVQLIVSRDKETAMSQIRDLGKKHGLLDTSMVSPGTPTSPKSPVSFASSSPTSSPASSFVGINGIRRARQQHNHSHVSSQSNNNNNNNNNYQGINVDYLNVYMNTFLEVVRGGDDEWTECTEIGWMKFFGFLNHELHECILDEQRLQQKLQKERAQEAENQQEDALPQASKNTNGTHANGGLDELTMVKKKPPSPSFQSDLKYFHSFEGKRVEQPPYTAPLKRLSQGTTYNYTPLPPRYPADCFNPQSSIPGAPSLSNHNDTVESKKKKHNKKKRKQTPSGDGSDTSSHIAANNAVRNNVWRSSHLQLCKQSRNSTTVPFFFNNVDDACEDDNTQLQNEKKNNNTVFATKKKEDELSHSKGVQTDVPSPPAPHGHTASPSPPHNPSDDTTQPIPPTTQPPSDRPTIRHNHHRTTSQDKLPPSTAGGNPLLNIIDQQQYQTTPTATRKTGGLFTTSDDIILDLEMSSIHTLNNSTATTTPNMQNLMCMSPTQSEETSKLEETIPITHSPKEEKRHVHQYLERHSRLVRWA